MAEFRSGPAALQVGGAGANHKSTLGLPNLLNAVMMWLGVQLYFTPEQRRDWRHARTYAQVGTTPELLARLRYIDALLLQTGVDDLTRNRRHTVLAPQRAAIHYELLRRGISDWRTTT